MSQVEMFEDFADTARKHVETIEKFMIKNIDPTIEGGESERGCNATSFCYAMLVSAFTLMKFAMSKNDIASMFYDLYTEKAQMQADYNVALNNNPELFEVKEYKEAYVAHQQEVIASKLLRTFKGTEFEGVAERTLSELREEVAQEDKDE